MLIMGVFNEAYKFIDSRNIARVGDKNEPTKRNERNNHK